MGSLGVMLLLGVLQGERPRLDVSVDEDRISVGEEVLYTLRAESHSSTPMQVTIAPFTGLEIVARSERTEVATDGGPTRTTVLEVRLRATRPGRWELGPARAVQGRDTVEASALVIDVAANRAATASTLSPRLRSLLERARPPQPGQAGIDLLVSSDSARLGEQVDVVTAAWFPRDLRLQLRRPPTLQPPVIDGVWSYPQATPTGIAATRNIGGRWYDLFVSHQIVFPLVPGRLLIPRATLKYSTPVALQFFSQEDRFAVSSRAETLAVRPLPAEGRPAAFTGAIGAGLRLERRVTPPAARVGDGITVELSLTGEGNLALWPAPVVRWPDGARAYVERIDEAMASEGGRLGGTKTFRYLVVPDSAGVLQLPVISYLYFDLAPGHYAELSASAASVPVTAGGESAAAAALPPPLLRKKEPSLSWRLAHGISDWVWVLLLVLPPLIATAWERGRGISLPKRPRTKRAARFDLRSAELELDALVRALVPDPDLRFGAGLAAAVRAAGADTELASRVAVLRERLHARRYGPSALVADDPALATEVRDVLLRLGGSLRGRRARGISVAVVLLAALGGALEAQSPAPEQLYQSGSLRAAAEGFSLRATEEPAAAANWYDLGATYYRLGAHGRAAAAWLVARRLAPREGVIRRAFVLTPPSDGTSARWTWSPPVTPEELLLTGGVLWIAGWLGWVIRPRLRERWLVLLVFAGAAVVAGLGLRAWYRVPLALVLDDAPLRVSPHGRAPALAPLESGTAVRIVRHAQGWVLVRAPGEREGWLPDDAIAAVGG
jgi:hypothetical protein